MTAHGPYKIHPDTGFVVRPGGSSFDDGELTTSQTVDELNSAHASGVQAERKRIVAQLRSRLDGGLRAIEVYMALATELERAEG